MNPRFQATLVFLRAYIARYGYPPTYREIAAGAGLSSTSVVHYQLRALEEDGYITRVPGSARAIAIKEQKP